jgi:hypothetical protein
VPSVSVFVLDAELIPTNLVAKEAGSTKGEEIYMKMQRTDNQGGILM